MNMCRSLAIEIREKGEKHLADFSDSPRSRILNILDALPSIDVLTSEQSVSSDTLQARLHQRRRHLTASAISLDLAAWRDTLLNQYDGLLRLQRYVAVAISKLPVEPKLNVGPMLSRDELTRARHLNMEIVACELLLGQSEVTSVPPNVQIEPTDRCNARCRSCAHRSTAGWSYHDIEAGSLDKLHHVLSIAQFVEIFGLGEPTISPSFGHIARLCESGASEAHVITNGTMLAEHPDIARLQKIGISFDGATKETFETIRVGIDFEKLITSIRTFRERNPSIFVYLTATINRANVNEIPGIAVWARTLGLQAVCYHRMYMNEPALVSTALCREDIPLYKERIREAEQALKGSDVKLFDYLLVEQLQASSEPLNSDESLVVIRSFKPKKEHFSGDLPRVISGLKGQKIPVPLDSELLCFSGETSEECLPKTTGTPALRGRSDSTNRSLAALEDRAAMLRSKVLQRPTEELRIPYCLAPWYRLCVKATGGLIPCSRWSRVYGNLNTIEFFNDAWNGGFHQKLRRAFHGQDERATTCVTCTCIDRYQGMTELLGYLRSLGISYDHLPKQEGFNPPEGKLQL